MSKPEDTPEAAEATTAVEEQYTKDVQISVDSVVTAYKTAKAAQESATKANNKSTYAYIVLGKALLNCRMVLRSGFKDHITESKTGISDKQVRRYMRFVSCPTTYDDLKKAPNSEDDVKLKVHPYIDKIKEHYLTTLKNQSMNKIDRMKKLETYADFKAVCKGKDEKYDEMIKEQKAKKEKTDKDALADVTKSYIDDGLSKDEIDQFRASSDYAIKEIIKTRKENKELEGRIDTDSDALYDQKQRLEIIEEALKRLQPQYPKLKETLEEVEQEKSQKQQEKAA